MRKAADDIQAALCLLTRLPLPPVGTRQAVWAWPVAGAVVGALAAFAATLGLSLGLPAGVVAALVLGTQAMLTGAMHEDGLADTVDGFWGGWGSERRLAIMKDSHIGTYGVLALLVTGLARWSALGVVVETGQHWPVLIAVGALSRVPMAVMIAVMRNARGAGLSHHVGRPSGQSALGAAGLGIGAALMATGSNGLVMLVLAATACTALAFLAKAKIGGQTGDVLGASQQLAETAALAAATLA